MEEDIRKMPEENRWYYILSKVMNLPGVKVNREKFLRQKFAKYYNEEKLMEILENGPVKAGVSVELIDKIAGKVISRHKGLAVVTSAISGLPGGLALFATIPADVSQYYIHILQVAQKLAYLYGFHDLEQDEDLLYYMTLFIGVMSGVEVANKGIKNLANIFAENTLKRLPKVALTKTAIYPIVKKIAKWLGVKMTKQLFAKSVAKAIPVISALFSGGLTWKTFSSEANRLRKNLREEFIIYL